MCRTDARRRLTWGGNAGTRATELVIPRPNPGAVCDPGSLGAGARWPGPRERRCSIAHQLQAALPTPDGGALLLLARLQLLAPLRRLVLLARRLVELHQAL